MISCMHLKKTIRFSLLIMILSYTGCARYTRIDNKPFPSCVQGNCKNEQLQTQRDYGDVVLLLSFSGGGTRAAAFSYGVLEELRNTAISYQGNTKMLLDEVDHISAVSGGSFTAAYYGLFGEQIFHDYEKVFLRQDVQKILIHSVLNPLNWFRLVASGFDRSSLAIEHYDRYIFRKKTFGDMLSRKGPKIQINATDLGTGEHFEFTPEMFGMLCSDIGSFKVAKAVAASSAVPIAFAPITVKNYPGCEAETAKNLESISKKYAKTPMLRKIVDKLATYNNKDQRQYIHLVDGGIADNLGVRSMVNHLMILDNIIEKGMENKKKTPIYIVILIVNAETNPTGQMEMSSQGPGMMDVISVVTDIQLHRYNLETVSMVKDILDNKSKSISASGREVKPYFIELKFDDLTDNKIKRFFNSIGTSLALSAKQVNMLRMSGRRLLKQSVIYKKLLHDLRNRQSGY